MEIAKKTGITAAMVSLILSGKKRPSWTTAKKLAAATGTTPDVWLDGTADQIREAIKSNYRRQGTKRVSQNQSNKFVKN